MVAKAEGTEKTIVPPSPLASNRYIFNEIGPPPVEATISVHYNNSET